MVKLYHYTTEKSAVAIQSSMIIYKSSGLRGDAFHGDGVYLTAIPPDFPKAKIIRDQYYKIDFGITQVL